MTVVSPAPRTRPHGSFTAPAIAPEQPTTLGDTRRLPSTAVLLEPGRFDINSLVAPGNSLGLLVLDGLLTAQLEAGRARVAWLLGADDLIRPWEMDELPLTRGARWLALTSATVLPVPGGTRRHTTGSPELSELLLARTARTGHWLHAQSLILSAPTIEERLLLLFAHYAERWGKVTPRGIRLDMPLTHELLARLCGARRSTVTLALQSLTTEGLLTRLSAGTWLLHQHQATNRPHRPPRNGPNRSASTATESRLGRNRPAECPPAATERRLPFSPQT